MKTRTTILAITLIMIITLTAGVVADETEKSSGWTQAWDAGFNCVGLGVALDNRGNVNFTGYNCENIPDAESPPDFLSADKDWRP